MIDTVTRLVRDHPKATVLFTGQSLGASLALLAYISVMEEFEMLMNKSNQAGKTFGHVQTRLVLVLFEISSNKIKVSSKTELFKKIFRSCF